MTLVPTDKSKDILEIYEDLQSKIRDLLRSITNNSDDYDEKYIKTKYNSDYNLPLKKRSEELYCHIITVVRSVFHEGNKYYP